MVQKKRHHIEKNGRNVFLIKWPGSLWYLTLNASCPYALLIIMTVYGRSQFPTEILSYGVFYIWGNVF